MVHSKRQATLLGLKSLWGVWLWEEPKAFRLQSPLPLSLFCSAINNDKNQVSGFWLKNHRLRIHLELSFWKVPPIRLMSPTFDGSEPSLWVSLDVTNSRAAMKTCWNESQGIEITKWRLGEHYSSQAPPPITQLMLLVQRQHSRCRARECGVGEFCKDSCCLLDYVHFDV